MNEARTRHIAILGSSTPCEAGAPPQLLEMAPPGIELVPWPMPIAAFPFTPFDKITVQASLAAAGAAAVAAGADALYIDTFGDYAIDALRSLGSVPVIGAGEATLHAGALIARRYSIVTVWPRSLRFIYDERLAMSGMGARCVSIRHVGDESETTRVGDSTGAMARLVAKDRGLVDIIVQACRDAIEHDGAEAILFGCTCMAPIQPIVAKALSAPVLCCSRTGFAMTLAALAGRWSSSEIAYPRVAVKRAARLGALLAGGSAGGEQGDDACPVCPIELIDRAVESPR